VIENHVFSDEPRENDRLAAKLRRDATILVVIAHSPHRKERLSVNFDRHVQALPLGARGRP